MCSSIIVYITKSNQPSFSHGYSERKKRQEKLFVDDTPYGYARSDVGRPLPLVSRRGTRQEKGKVRECSKNAERWLFQKLDQQANIPPSKNPVRFTAALDTCLFCLFYVAKT